MSVVAVLKPLARKTALAPARTRRAFSDGTVVPADEACLDGALAFERADEVVMKPFHRYGDKVCTLSQALLP